MPIPAVAPRVKKGLHFARQRVDATQVGTFVKVAAVAGQREIVSVIESAVLPGNHVLNMMRQVAISLVKPAILASILCPFADQPPRAGIHVIVESLPDAAGL